MKRVLIVDDERKMRRLLQMMLEQLGLESLPAETGEEAVELFAAGGIDMVLTDLRLPGMSGIDCLTKIREIDPDTPVIVLTAYGTVQTAVEAMKRGAFDYVLKPFQIEALELAIRRALELQQYRIENRYLRAELESAAAFEDLVGRSAAMQTVFELVRQVAPTKSTVLITGETGTGKELVARAIHNRSDRRSSLFVPLNCAAIPADLLETELFGHTRGAFTGAHAARVGRFQVADGGSLFLDEIGDMPFSLQAKLLRVVQESVVEPIGGNRSIPVNVRILSSTNRDLGAAIKAGEFREDLYYRLNVFEIHLPPLRERREDIRPMAAYFLERISEELGKPVPRVEADALAPLESYDWPGNVRELRNAMERAAVLADRGDLDARFFRSVMRIEPAPEAAVEAEPAEESMNLEAAVAGVERKVILRALAASGDNKAEAARLLGVSERTLWYKLKKYGL